MKLTAGAKLFIVVLILIPVLLIGSLVVENQQPASISVAKKKTEKQVKFNDLYKFVRKNQEWYPFTSGLLEFYK